MIVSKLLMYGLTDEENYLVDFYFDENQVQAVFCSKRGTSFNSYKRADIRT
jgi:hypothetical protein